MENNNTFLTKTVFMVVGVFFGWLVWGSGIVFQGNTHVMPDGSVMSNDGVDMHQMMSDMTGVLYGKTGDDFDKAFLTEMIVHHEGAVDMAELVLENSKRPELIQLAKDIISAQTKEINQMEEWGNTWFK